MKIVCNPSNTCHALVIYPPPSPRLEVGWKFSNIQNMFIEILEHTTHIFDDKYCGLVNNVHPRYYLQCFYCGNELNRVAQ